MVVPTGLTKDLWLKKKKKNWWQSSWGGGAFRRWLGLKAGCCLLRLLGFDDFLPSYLILDSLIWFLFSFPLAVSFFLKFLLAKQRVRPETAKEIGCQPLHLACLACGREVDRFELLSFQMDRLLGGSMVSTGPSSRRSRSRMVGGYHESWKWGQPIEGAFFFLFFFTIGISCLELLMFRAFWATGERLSLDPAEEGGFCREVQSGASPCRLMGFGSEWGDHLTYCWWGLLMLCDSF